MCRDIADQLGRLPLVVYHRKLAIGRAVEQHLQRVRINPGERFTFDSSRSIFSMVARCGGWALTTPICFLDNDRIRNDLDVRPLPFAGFSRRIWLAARRREFGGLPADMAVLCRDLLRNRLVPQALDVAPWTKPAFEFFDDTPGNEDEDGGLANRQDN